MATVPVRSPLLFYERRGVPASLCMCSVPNFISARCLAEVLRLGRRTQRSRDLSLRAPSRRPRVSLPRLLPLLALATACAEAPATGQQHVVFTLPMSIALLVFGAALVGFVSGVTLGMRQALTFLRAADTAASQYHREEIAKILHASSTVHDLVQDIVQQAHARIRTLRTQLQDLKEEAQR